MEKSKLFVASCISLVTTSMVFAIRGDIANDMAAAFHLSNEQLGLIFSPAFWCFTISILISGALVDIAVAGGAGMLSVAVALLIMGARIDSFGPGAALQMMAALALPLVAVFAGMHFYRARARQPARAL